MTTAAPRRPGTSRLRGTSGTAIFAAIVSERMSAADAAAITSVECAMKNTNVNMMKVNSNPPLLAVDGIATSEMKSHGLTNGPDRSVEGHFACEERHTPRAGWWARGFGGGHETRRD